MLKAAIDSHPDRRLFAGMVAFFSPLLPPSLKCIWCHEGGRVATEQQHASEITVFFGVHDRSDDLIERLRDIDFEIIHHAWITDSLTHRRKLNLAPYAFTSLDNSIAREKAPASPTKAKSVGDDSALDGTHRGRRERTRIGETPARSDPISGPFKRHKVNHCEAAGVVKIESDEETASRDTVDQQRGSRFAPVSPPASLRAFANEMSPSIPTPSFGSTHAPPPRLKSSWPQLRVDPPSSVHSSTRTILADDFLASFSSRLNGEPGAKHSNLRFGLSLMEHGQDGFFARRRTDSKLPDKTQRKTGAR